MGGGLRLYDHRGGTATELPRRRLLRIELRDAGLRAVVTADLLRRVATRHGHQVVSGGSGGTDWTDWTDYNVLPLGQPEGAPDVYVTPAPMPARCLVVPDETGDWQVVLAAGGFDPLHARLAMLEARYREPLELTGTGLLTAGGRLDRWRALVAGWARQPGRPMDRAYAAEAEAALADDLGSPAALKILDRLADDPAVAPGAKLETFIHLDLLLALDMVRDIGRY